MTHSQELARVRFEEREKTYLGKAATLSTDERCIHRVHAYKPDPIRSEFQRDYTRIIHSRAFRRLRHKTQVFISPKNDHVCTRMEHSLHVASVSQTIARALSLNEDLVIAIAVGHDLGHAPFGHMGEISLDEIAKENDLIFAHELHSLRVVDVLESPYDEYNGLNLTFAVRDGIVCHYGEAIPDENGKNDKFERKLAPDQTKKPEDLNHTERGKSRPTTLEGCVVRWADKVAYLGRDLEDAVDPNVRIVDREDLPERVQNTLGRTNREIISRLVEDLINCDNGDGEISVSDDVHLALNDLYDFNMERIYKSDAATRHRSQIQNAMKFLFGSLLRRLENADGDVAAVARDGEDLTVLRVFAEFLRDDIRDLDAHNPKQLVIDYIAGMTDSFFIDSFTELFLPRSIV